MSEEKPSYETLTKQVAEMRQSDLAACMKEIDAVLKKYRCAIRGVTIISDNRVETRIQVQLEGEKPQ